MLLKDVNTSLWKANKYIKLYGKMASEQGMGLLFSRSLCEFRRTIQYNCQLHQCPHLYEDAEHELWISCSFVSKREGLQGLQVWADLRHMQVVWSEPAADRGAWDWGPSWPVSKVRVFDAPFAKFVPTICKVWTFSEWIWWTNQSRLGIQFGKWILLENIGEQLDPALEPVLKPREELQVYTVSQLELVFVRLTSLNPNAPWWLVSNILGRTRIGTHSNLFVNPSPEIRKILRTLHVLHALCV